MGGFQTQSIIMDEIKYNSTRIDYPGLCELNSRQDFSAGHKSKIEIIKTFKLNIGGPDYPYYEEINKKHLTEMVDNFNNKALGNIRPFIDIDHEVKEAAGWLLGVELSAGGNKIIGEVEWTELGIDAIKGKKYRYFSPSFYKNYSDPFKEKHYGMVLKGGGLTNFPFLTSLKEVSLNRKGMKMDKIKESDFQKMADEILSLKGEVARYKADAETVNASSEKIKNDFVGLSSTLKEKETELTALRDNGQKTNLSNNELMSANDSLKLRLSNIEGQNIKLSEDIAALQREKMAKEKRDMNFKLFNDGKINKAQLAYMNDNPDHTMTDVLSLNNSFMNAPLGKTGSDGNFKFTAEDNSVANKLGLTKEDYKNNEFGRGMNDSVNRVN